MTRKEILEKLYDEQMNYVFAYSANYKMDAPKRGYERQFDEAREIADELKEMLAEEARTEGV